MANYFDKHGNVYRIDDPKVLTKKEQVEVWSEDGEEFSIPAKSAAEYRLTADEKGKVMADLTDRLAELLKGGCPVVDPPMLSAVLGTRAAAPQTQLAAALRAIGGGGGCLAIDPVDLGSILGTRILPQQSQLVSALQRANVGGGVQNVELTNLGALLGALAQVASPQASLAEKGLGGGCPNIDPPNMLSVLGTLAQLFARPQASALGQLFGGGCPNIDPVQIGSLLGTIAALRGARF